MKRTGGGTGFNGDKIVCDKLFLSLKIDIILFFFLRCFKERRPREKSREEYLNCNIMASLKEI